MKWYKFDIREFKNTEYDKWYSLLSKEKQQQVDSFRYKDDKKRTVAGEMLVKKAISSWCGVDAESIILGIKGHGKPYAKDLNVEFNISHSGDMVVCAVDSQPVGIDIEMIRPINLKVAKKICSDEELFYLFGYIPTEEDFKYTTNKELLTRFYKIWTAKEAFGKCNGKGLTGAKKYICNDVKTFVINKKYVLSIKTDK